MKSRREFIKAGAAAGGAMLTASHLTALSKVFAGSVIACQQYPWSTFFKREGRDWFQDIDSSILEVTRSGFASFEPTFDSVEAVEKMKPVLKKYKIDTKSLYVNSKLHDEADTEDSIAQVMKIAKAAKPLGIEILVTNPSPINWGGPEDKTDEQLITQAKALNKLGSKLRDIGIALAYHTHDAEMRNSAREFHHMLLGTDPDNVKLCLDAHWIYRGSGDSQVALFDIVDLYIDRVIELHLRQSRNGIWTEEFTTGDIEYSRLADKLASKNNKPHIVLEQAIEEGSPNTMNGIKAHKIGLVYAEQVFTS